MLMFSLPERFMMLCMRAARLRRPASSVVGLAGRSAAKERVREPKVPSGVGNQLRGARAAGVLLGLRVAAEEVVKPVNSSTPGLTRLIPVGVPGLTRNIPTGVLFGLGAGAAGALGAAGLVTQRSTPTEFNFCTKGSGFGAANGVPKGWRRCLARRASRSGWRARCRLAWLDP
jgi:hypothetical protein